MKIYGDLRMIKIGKSRITEKEPCTSEPPAHTPLFFPAGHLAASGIQRSSIKRMLVRGPNWIGDAVMSEPALTRLRSLFPEAELTLLVKPPIAELFKQHPAIDHLMVYEDREKHAGLGGKWNLAKTLRRGRFDLAILLQNAFEAAFLAFLAGIPRRYGYATDGRSLLLTSSVGVAPGTKRAHQVHYYLDLIKPLGADGYPAPPRLYVSSEEEQRMALRLSREGITPDQALIGINPGSTYGGAKRWIPERFAQAADRLVRRFEEKVGRVGRAVLIGAAGEEALGDEIAHRMETVPLILSGKTSVRELMAVIKRCNLFLTNDTGPMHIAAAFGVPLVAVFGPTDFRTTAPYGERNRLVRHPVECSPCLLRECPIDHRCMTGVTVESVVEAGLQLVEKIETGPGRPGPEKSGDGGEGVPHSFPLEGVTVFLDRDGTINRDTGYVKTPDALELFPGAVEAISRLNRAGAKVVLVTNQSGVGRGLFSLETLAAIHGRLSALLEQGGACLDKIYYCPHHPDEGCLCRKPKTGLIEQSVAELGVDLSRSYVVGDQARDVGLARQIGARSVLVTTGQTTPEALGSIEAEGCPPDRVAQSLAEAVSWILADAASRQCSAVRPEEKTVR